MGNIFLNSFLVCCVSLWNWPEACMILTKLAWNDEVITLVYKNMNSLFIYENCGEMAEWERERVDQELLGFTPCWDTNPEPCFFMLLLQETDTEGFSTWGPLASTQNSVTWKLPSLYIFLGLIHFFPCNLCGISVIPCSPSDTAVHPVSEIHTNWSVKGQYVMHW